MQEWVIAMFVISLLLIIRDMAKIILSGEKKKSLQFPKTEEHPQKEKVKGYADAFRKLADSFYGMPYKKEFLSSGQVEQVIRETCDRVCSRCYQKEFCWESQAAVVYQAAEKLVRSMEEGQEEAVKNTKTEWAGICSRSVQYADAAGEAFSRERQNLMWGNRMIETRLAVAQQMWEVSGILQSMAQDLYDISPADPVFTEELKQKLRKNHIILKQAWVMDKVEGRRQIFLTIRTAKKQCVSIGEAAGILSDVCKTQMTAAEGSRCVLNGEFHAVHFVEDVSYQILYGVSRLTREKESVSGDNFLCRQENGRFVMCLSDGMGSGMEACRESEAVVELLEQFLEAGFSQETAARMVNSALVIKGQNGMFSTVDLCAIDLYTGICSFLKAGAAATFVRRDHWVEAIASESLAVGIVQQMEFETAARKLYHGDYLIMMTDGVLDALPAEREEETMKEIIMDVQEENPKEMSRGILERVLGYSDYCAKDDMTVLVAGLWKK